MTSTPFSMHSGQPDLRGSSSQSASFEAWRSR